MAIQAWGRSALQQSPLLRSRLTPLNPPLARGEAKHTPHHENRLGFKPKRGRTAISEGWSGRVGVRPGRKAGSGRQRQGRDRASSLDSGCSLAYDGGLRRGALLSLTGWKRRGRRHRDRRFCTPCKLATGRLKAVALEIGVVSVHDTHPMWDSCGAVGRRVWDAARIRTPNQKEGAKSWQAKNPL